MLFKYNGIDASGKKIKSKIEANSLEEAKGKLKARKILYTAIQEDTLAVSNFSFKRKYKIPTLVLANISRDLSIYLDSGVSLVNAIKLIKQTYKKDKKLNAFFESIYSFLDEGKNLYTALDKQDSVILPDFYKQSIKVSENGGLLKSVLLELSTFLKEQDRIKKQTGSALAYPLFILGVSVLMVGFMLSFIVPKITSIFTQFDQELPKITTIVIDLGDFFSNNYQIILIAILAAILSFSYAMKKSKAFKFFMDKFFLKVPYFNSLIELSELSRFSYMNSILIRSGVPVVQSFKLSSDILKNSVIKKVFMDASSKVVEGKKLSTILENDKTYRVDSSFIQAIAIGEETSQLNKVLQNLAELYNESNKDKIAIFLALLEPMFMLFVGGTIGTIVVAMLLPIFSMNLG